MIQQLNDRFENISFYFFPSLTWESGLLNIDVALNTSFGKWIDLNVQDEIYGNVYKCSNCYHEAIGKNNYCPNCGAKMKGSNTE